MRYVILALALLSFSLLFSQISVIDSLASVHELQGFMMLGYDGSILWIGNGYDSYYIGDGWSQILMCGYASVGFISLPIPQNVSADQIVSAMLNLYCYDYAGDDVLRAYPVFELQAGTVAPSVLISHIDYGFNLDSSDINAPNLQPAVTFVDSSSCSVGWQHVDITEFLRDDMVNNRLFSQYKLTLQYGPYVSDWDFMVDGIHFYSDTATSMQMNPFMVVEYIRIPVAPTIEHIPVNAISNYLMPMLFECSVTDDAPPCNVVMRYHINNDYSTNVVMNTNDNLHYQCIIDPILPAVGGHFYYKISATDTDNNTTVLPENGWFEIEFLPTNVINDTEPARGINSVSAFPNPFGNNTSIIYMLPQNGDCSLTIYNMRGQKIRNLTKGPGKQGQNTVQWDCRDDKGIPVGNGIYFCKIYYNKSRTITKLLKIK